MREVNKFVLIPKEKRDLKKETGFPFFKKAKEEVSSGNAELPPKELKPGLEFHYEKNSETVKILKESYENKRLKVFPLKAMVFDNVDSGVDKKFFFNQLNWPTLQLIHPNVFLDFEGVSQTGSITISDRMKLQKLYNERRPAAFGFENNLTKASGLNCEKITEVLNSKTSMQDTKKRSFSRLNVHARYMDEIGA